MFAAGFTFDFSSVFTLVRENFLVIPALDLETDVSGSERLLVADFVLSDKLPALLALVLDVLMVVFVVVVSLVVLETVFVVGVLVVFVAVASLETRFVVEVLVVLMSGRIVFFFLLINGRIVQVFNNNTICFHTNDLEMQDVITIYQHKSWT